MRIRIDWRCPNCGHENSDRFDAHSQWHKTFVNCNSEDGGCDEDFAASIVLRPCVTLYQLEKCESDTE